MPEPTNATVGISVHTCVGGVDAAVREVLQRTPEGIIKNRADVEQRPAEVQEKKRFGDLAIGTNMGRNHKGAIATINDRKAGFLWMKKVDERTSDAVYRATADLLKEEKECRHAITGDNGNEIADHQKIAQELQISIYFAKPYHSWERGANENRNGLIRQYVPKKTDFKTIDDEFLQLVANSINSRPRKRYSYKSPIFVKNQLLTKT